MKTVCFWGDIYSAIHGLHPGGAEKQIAIMAKMFSELSWRVIVADTETENDINVNGLSIISVKKFLAGKKYVYLKRFYYLYKLFLNINPQLFYLRIRGFQHIIPVLASKKTKSKIIFGVSSDLDIDSFTARWKYYYKYHSPKYFLTRGLLTEALFPFIIKSADLILTQNSNQGRLCSKKNIRSLEFHNIINRDDPKYERAMKDYFIIIGSLDKRKGFDVAYRLIKELPEIKFMLIGSPRDKSSHAFINDLQNMNNVRIMGRLSQNEVVKYLYNAKALVNTSPKEGFPNVFLESWSVDTPVISLFVNPNDVLTMHRLGIYCKGSFANLKHTIINFNSKEFEDSCYRIYLHQNHSYSYGISRLKKAEQIISS